MSLNILEILEKRSSDNPSKTAFTFLENTNKILNLTHKELYDGSLKIAANLELQIKKQPVIILLPGELTFIKAFLGCLGSLNIAVPLAVPNKANIEVLINIIINSGARHILSNGQMIEAFSSSIPEVKWINVDKIEAVSEHYKVEPTADDDIAVLQYTSGSTGFPKGVKVSYGNIFHNCDAIRNHFEIDQNSVSFSWLPHYHDMGLIDGILQPILSGCKAILTSPRKVVGNPRFWFETISRFGVTHTGGPNFFYDLCNERVEPDSNWSLRSLKNLYISAEPVRMKTLDKFIEKFSVLGFEMEKFTPGYGLAEATLMVSCKKAGLPIVTKRFSMSDYVIDSVSLGLVVPGIELKIVNPDSKRVCAEGEKGEIWLKGDSVTSGYWNNLAKTSETFDKLENDKQTEYLRTGDIGVVDDHQLFVVGRLKDTICLNGINYYAEDIEYRICNADNRISKGACLAFSIETGEEEQLKLLVKITPDLLLELNQIERSVRKAIFEHFGLSNLPIQFHTGPAYSKTTSGKVKRSRNKELFLSGHFNLVSQIRV